MRHLGNLKDKLLDPPLLGILFAILCIVYNTILFVFVTIDHSFALRHDAWFGLGCAAELLGTIGMILFLWEKSRKWCFNLSYFFVFCVPISLFVYPKIIAKDYEEQIQYQEAILTQRLNLLTQKVKTLQLRPAPDNLLPKRPYVLMSAPLLNEMPDMSEVSIGSDFPPRMGPTDLDIRRIAGSVPFGEMDVDITCEVLSSYPDFCSSTRSIIVVGQDWRPSGKFVELDDHSKVPEMIHNVRAFVVDFPSGYLVWRSKLYLGGPASLPLIRSPTGGVTFVSSLYGSSVKNIDLSEIPWDQATNGAKHK